MSTNVILVFIIGLLHLHYCMCDFEFEDYHKLGHEEHNKHRECHNASALKLDETLTEIADICAGHYFARGHYDGSCPQCPLLARHFPENTRKFKKWYENSYQTSGNNKDLSSLVKEACDFWYSECPHFDFTEGQVSDKTGHFARMVAPALRDFGIGVFTLDNISFVVAIYDHPHTQINVTEGPCTCAAQFIFSLNPVLVGVQILIIFGALLERRMYVV